MATKRKKSEAVTVIPRTAGRPDEYDQVLFDEVIRRLSGGEPLAAICRDEHMPSLRSVYRWKDRNYENLARFAHAREDGEEIIAASIMDIADAPPPLTAMGSTDGGAVQHAKLRIETRLKLLAKWNPKKWGEKLGIGGADELPPVQTNATVTLDPSEAYRKLLGGAK